MAGASDAILAELKCGLRSASELRHLCASRKAVIQNIYRLREAGHEIVLHPSGSPKVEPRYQLIRLADSLGDWVYPST